MTAFGDLQELVNQSGLRRVHVLAWRDLVDIEAGGSELHAAKVLKIWADAGLDITMRTSYAQGHPYEGTRDGYRVIRKHGRISVFPTTVLSEMMRANGPRDAIVEIWNGVPFLSPVWFRGPKVTWIHHVHRDMWEMVLSPQMAKFGKVFEKRIAPPFYRSTPIVTLSESSRHEIHDYLKIPDENISVVPPGIDDFFSPLHNGQNEKSPTPLVVAVGRLMPSKKFDDLIYAMAQVHKIVPNAELVIVGDGYERPQLLEQIEKIGAQSWIRLAGRVSDEELRSLYRRAWCVASASIAEGWGMTLTEAAACGTPAVATDIAGHRDAVARDKSGLLTNDVRGLVSCLTAVLTDTDLRRRLEDGALAHAATLRWSATAYGTFLPLAQQCLPREK